MVQDGDVTTESIENAEVARRQPDNLSVRIAEILGTDPDATSDAMARVESAESANPAGGGADGRWVERDVAGLAVVATERRPLNDDTQLVRQWLDAARSGDALRGSHFAQGVQCAPFIVRRAMSGPQCR